MDVGISSGSCSTDEHLEITEAAETLYAAKNAKLDTDQANALEEMKRLYLRNKPNQENSESPVSRSQPRISHSQEYNLQGKPDELPEIIEAAETLYIATCAKLGTDEANALEEVKRQYPADKRNQENSQGPVSRRQPKISQSQESTLQGKEKTDIAQESAPNSPGDQQLPVPEDVATNLVQNHMPPDISSVPSLNGFGEWRGPLEKTLTESDLTRNNCRLNKSDVANLPSSFVE